MMKTVEIMFEKIKSFCQSLTTNRWFEHFITFIIVLNCFLIGVETYHTNETITFVQNTILGIFTIEILLRFIAADGIKAFFSNGWNVFDLSLVLVCFIPESAVSNGTTLMALRVLRVFRVLRLLRSAKEIKLIVTVLIKSLSALFYNVIFFFIFIYLFAIVGVSLFRLPTPEQMTEEQRVKYEEFMKVAPNAPSNSPDPFGSLDESFFTLFRELTGEDWTDVRYNLITASEYGLIKVNSTIVTSYHVIWFIVSAFLLLNLVVGAIVNNYQVVMEQSKKEKERNNKVS